MSDQIANLIHSSFGEGGGINLGEESYAGDVVPIVNRI